MEAMRFSSLPLSDKLDQVQKEGVFIGKRIVDQQKVLLYQLDSFYVEIYYKRYRKQIDKVEISTETTVIDFYP